MEAKIKFIIILFAFFIISSAAFSNEPQSEANDAISGNENTMKKKIDQDRGLNEIVPSDAIGAGKLRIYIVRRPESWDYRTNDVDRYVDDFGGSEWIAVFRDVLKCPMGIGPLRSGEDTREFRERNRISFQQAIPHYPMLGRIWDTYADVIYTPTETGQLRHECMIAKSGTSDSIAITGLDKLIHACDEALECGLGIFLACD